MFCMKCGTEMPDDANFCLKCGYNFKEVPVVQEQSPINPEMDIQRDAAQNEMKKLEKSGSVRGWILLGCLFGIPGIIVTFVSGFQDEQLLIIGCFGIALWAFATAWNTYNRKRELEMIIQGKQRISICPYCKSSNIVAEMVKSGQSTQHGTTRISNNINPLHPFTHTNVKQGKTQTQNQYGQMFQCKNCGKVFNSAEVYYR